MTVEQVPTLLTRDDVAESAVDAARTAGATFRALRTSADMRAATDLLATVWGVHASKAQVTPELLTAMAHAGNYVVGGYRGETMVAACLGFFGAPAGEVLHSHIAGVHPDVAGAGIGKALKLHQRLWAYDQGLRAVTWTFDPLVARNAYFNLEVLGAVATHHLIDFYGSMDDTFNAGQPSDRIVVRWDIAAAQGSRAHRPAVQVLVDASGEPLIDWEQLDTGANTCRLKIPSDITSVRAHDQECALRWRLALRITVTTLLDRGWSVTGFERDGSYLLELG